MKAVIGLGNPGHKYERTRHNAGFWVIDELMVRADLPRPKTTPTALISQGVWSGKELLAVKPQTFMNRSGQAVRALIDAYRLQPEDLLVVYDDLNLEPGVVRMRAKGGSGGHNGMKSIIESLGTEQFPRLRLGIGDPSARGMAGVDYVLAPPSKDDKPYLEAAVQAATSAALTWVESDVNEAMSRFNGRYP